MSRHAAMPLVSRSYDALTIQLDDTGSATDNRGYFIKTVDQRGNESMIRLKVDELRAIVEWAKDKGETL